jgi:hypothetical protein
MNKLLFTILFTAAAVFAHTIEPAGPPPSGLDPAVAGVLQKDGIRVKDGNKIV